MGATTDFSRKRKGLSKAQEKALESAKYGNIGSNGGRHKKSLAGTEHERDIFVDHRRHEYSGTRKRRKK